MEGTISSPLLLPRELRSRDPSLVGRKSSTGPYRIHRTEGEILVPCVLIVRVGVRRCRRCVRRSLRGTKRRRGKSPGEERRTKRWSPVDLDSMEERDRTGAVSRGSVTNEANITRPIQLNTRSTVTVGKTEYF